MSVILANDYQGTEVLTSEETAYTIKRALSGDYEGFKFFFENCLLIQDRDTREYIHPKLNKGQQMIAKAIFKNVNKETREDKTAGKYFKQKIAPIVTNVPDYIYPTIERDTIGTSTLLKFKDIKGIPRGGYYEVVSAGSNSVRSGTVSVWLCDEPSEYRNPEMVEDAISGAISSYAWSFTAYIGTFSDRLSNYFLNKIKLALDNPNEIELVFIPWFLVYGRDGDDAGYTVDDYTEYDKNVIIPEMRKYGIPENEWLSKIGWYHTRGLRTSKLRYEFPSSIDDIINMTSDRMVFSEDSIKKQEENILSGKKYRMVTDHATGKVEAQETDVSPFTIFKEPIYGHSYRISIDPITAQSQDTDNFVMQVMDRSNNEQVAVFREKGLQDEDYADWAVSIGTIYNKAELCPEINVGNGFVVAVNSRRYYRWYYSTKSNKAERVPGLRTTVSTKERYIDSLSAMLDRGTIIIHDAYTLDELRSYVKQVKTRQDGSQYVRMNARPGKHDDDCAALFIYAGSLDLRDIEGKKHSRFAMI